MTKREFLDELRSRLSGLPEDELEERIEFYEEMIDDRIEEGISEEDAVRGIGDLDAVVSQILSDRSLDSLLKERIRPKRKLTTWEIVLLIVGAPVWVPLLMSIVSVIFSFYVALWSIIIALWAVFVSFVASAVGLVASGVGHMICGQVALGVATVGVALLLAGLSIFTFFGCRAATKGVELLGAKIWSLIKKAIVGKEKIG